MVFCSQRFENGPAEKRLFELKADSDKKKKKRKVFPFATLSVCDFTDDLVAERRTNLHHRLLKSKHSLGAFKQNMKLPSLQGRNLTLNAYTCNGLGTSEMLGRKSRPSEIISLVFRMLSRHGAKLRQLMRAAAALCHFKALL